VAHGSRGGGYTGQMRKGTTVIEMPLSKGHRERDIRQLEYAQERGIDPWRRGEGARGGMHGLEGLGWEMRKERKEDHEILGKTNKDSRGKELSIVSRLRLMVKSWV